MNEDQNLRAALAYAELGYAVFPLERGGKRPATAHGLHDATIDEQQITAWWRKDPGYNIGIRTDGLLVLDVDGAENPYLSQHEERLSSLHGSPTQRTPGGGLHVFFRQPDGGTWRNTASRLAAHVDTRANGGYVAAAPSRVEGKAYEWVEEHELLDPPAALATPPEWLADQLDACGQHHRLQLKTDGGGSEILNGTRNTTLTRIAGAMRRFGATQSMIASALQAANLELCSSPLDTAEVDKVAASISRLEPDQISAALVFDLPATESESEKPIPDPGPFPKRLLDVPGFIGRYMEFDAVTAYRHQPILALGAAIALLSVLTGRKITDRRGTQTNIYILGVAPSGAGKENARRNNKRILNESGLQRLNGGEGFASSAGLIAAVELQPASLFQIDEIGRVLATTGDAKTPHLYHIATALMRLFSSAGQVYQSDCYADVSRNKTIRWPHAVLYGTTVPDSLFGSLTSESIADGFLGRMLVFEAPSRVPPVRPGLTIPTPIDLLADATAWGDLSPGGGNLAGENPNPLVLSYSVEAQDRFEVFERLCEVEREQSAYPMDALWVRAPEKAAKLALLAAASEDGPGVEQVPERAVAWSVELTEYLTRRLLWLTERNVADGLYEKLSKRVVRIVDSAMPRGISMTDLGRKLQGVKARDRKEVIDDLVGLGRLRIEVTATGKRPRTTVKTPADKC